MTTEPEQEQEQEEQEEEDLDPNEEEEQDEGAEDSATGEADSVSEEDWATLETLKKHAGGRPLEDVLRLAQDGLEYRKRKVAEEDEMFKQREAEKTAGADNDDDGTGDDLVSRKEAARMVKEALTESRSEELHEDMVRRHELTPEQAYAARPFVERAIADKRNRGVTIEEAYGYWVAEVLKKNQADDDKAKPKAEETKGAMRRGARANRARPPASGGATADIPSASGLPSWDNVDDPSWNMFDPEREKRYKKELGVR